MDTDIYGLLIETLEKSMSSQFSIIKEEMKHMRMKTEDIGRIEAAHTALKEDIARLYSTIKDGKEVFAESIQRIHSRIDQQHQFFIEKVGEITGSIGNATNRIEQHLGAKVTEQGEKLNILKNDYDQKISAIKAVWYVLGIVIIGSQAAAGFLIKAYISDWQNRIVATETSIVDQKKASQKTDESLKELQSEVLRGK